IICICLLSIPVRRFRRLLRNRNSKAVSFSVLFPRRRSTGEQASRSRFDSARGGWLTSSPCFTHGRGTSGGRSSGYGKAHLFGQRAPTAPADLPTQIHRVPRSAGVRADPPAPHSPEARGSALPIKTGSEFSLGPRPRSVLRFSIVKSPSPTVRQY